MIVCELDFDEDIVMVSCPSCGHANDNEALIGYLGTIGYYRCSCCRVVYHIDMQENINATD